MCVVFGHPAAAPAGVLPSRRTGRSRMSLLWSSFTTLSAGGGAHILWQGLCQLCSQQVTQRHILLQTRLCHLLMPSPACSPGTESLTPLHTAGIPEHLTFTWMLPNLGLFCALLPNVCFELSCCGSLHFPGTKVHFKSSPVPAPASLPSDSVLTLEGKLH